MGDVDRGDAELALQRADLLAQGDADLGVERRQRLVEQQDLRLDGEGAGQRHALLLAAGELVGIAPAQRRQLDQAEHLLDPRARSASGRFATFRPKATFSATVMLGNSA